jgi:hypothetical protein
MVADKIANMKKGEVYENQHAARPAQICAGHGAPVPQTQAAKILNVSRHEGL